MSIPQPPPRDGSLIQLLQDRDGLASVVVLNGGERLTVFNIAWGYDMGDEYAHVTTNISPDVEGATIDLFFTSDVAVVLDPASGAVLLKTA